MLNYPDLLGILLNSLGDSVVLISPNGTILCANEATSQLIEGSAEETVGKHCWEVFHTPPLQPDSCPLLKLPIEHREKTVFFRKKWLRVTVDPMLDSDGKLLGIVHIMRDVTERVQAEEALQRSEQRYRSLFLDVPVPFYLTNMGGKFIDVNSAFVELLGYPSREYVVENVSVDDVFIITHERMAWRDRIKRKKKVTDFETQVRCSDGTLIWVVDEAAMMRTPRGIRFRGSLQNVNSLKEQAISDPLTGLFNRRYMEDFLRKVIHRATREDAPVGVIMLDIDLFKKYNDVFGHDAGDLVLKELSTLLATHARPGDIVCRYGGEEFVMVLSGAPEEVIKNRAEKIRVDVKRLNINHRDNFLGQVTISAGVAMFPEHGITSEELIRFADAALYKAKEGGRDRVVVAGWN